MLNKTDASLTEAVLATLDGATDVRLKRVMESLIRHLHSFVRETQLTEAEWFTAVEFLTATGKKCDDKRQEFILLSDTLGVSMLVDAINHRKSSGATESTVLGPFYVRDAPEMPSGANIAEGVDGEPTYFSGKVSMPDGEPLAGATLDIWSTDGAGLYDVQRPGDEMRARGRIMADEHGCYAFWTIKPVSYPVPTDGPVGQMLLKMGRHPYRPAHTHVIVSAPGYEAVTTHVFVKGDPYLESDAVFAVKDSLVVDFVRHEPGVAPGGKTIDRPWFSVRYDFSLVQIGTQPGRVTMSERTSGHCANIVVTDSEKGRAGMKHDAISLIKGEHRSLAAVTDTMTHLVRNAERTGKVPDFRLLHAMLYYIREFPERRHHPSEDRSLFALLKKRTHEADDAIGELMTEHVKGEAMLSALTVALSTWEAGRPNGLEDFRDELKRFSEFYWRHMQKEETNVLSIAQRQLTDQDWLEVKDAFSAHGDPLLGKDKGDEFDSLFSEIVQTTPAPLGLGDPQN